MAKVSFFAWDDAKTSLYWLVPCSSKTDKYEKIIKAKKDKHRPTDAIKVVTIQGRKCALLFQDMFPICEKYIKGQYIRGGQEVYIADPKMVNSLEKTAKKVVNLLRRGICFTPTQPNVQAIEQQMQDEMVIGK